MARTPVVSRTMKATLCNVLCLDIESGEPCNKEVKLPRTYKDDKKLMKKVSEQIDSESIKAVHIVDKKELTYHVEMSEEKFMAEGTVTEVEAEA